MIVLVIIYSVLGIAGALIAADVHGLFRGATGRHTPENVDPDATRPFNPVGRY